MQAHSVDWFLCFSFNRVCNLATYFHLSWLPPASTIGIEPIYCSPPFQPFVFNSSFNNFYNCQHRCYGYLNCLKFHRLKFLSSPSTSRPNSGSRQSFKSDFQVWDFITVKLYTLIFKCCILEFYICN